jgi:hypothetical protein
MTPVSAICKRSRKSKVPVCRHRRTIPMRRPTSAALVIQKALTAARAASGRVYQ